MLDHTEIRARREAARKHALCLELCRDLTVLAQIWTLDMMFPGMVAEAAEAHAAARELEGVAPWTN